MAGDSDSDVELTEEEAWMEIQISGRISIDLKAAFVAAGVETADDFLGHRGLMEQYGAQFDLGVVGMLAKLHNQDASIGTTIDCRDANSIRTLVLKARKELDMPRSSKPKVVISGTTGSVAETEAEEAREATSLFKHLQATQGVDVDPRDHLNHALVAKMASSLRKNGSINQCITFGDMYKQNERKRSQSIVVNSQVELSLGGQHGTDSDASSMTFSKVVIKLLAFCKGLAAVFGKEVKETVDIDRYSLLMVKPVKGTVGSSMLVQASYPEIMQYFEVLVTAMSNHAVRFAESIFQRSFGMLMSLFDKHGFRKALKDLSDSHSRYLRPSDDELAAFEKEKRDKAASNDKANREAALERKAGEKARREARATLNKPDAPRASGKYDPPGKPICHSMAFKGTCSRGDACNFEHNKEKCAAYKEKYPNGPPEWRR